MGSLRLHSDLIELERKLQTPSYQELLSRLHPSIVSHHKFVTWLDVIDFMRKGTSRDPAKDQILKAIFSAHQSDRDHRWRTILMTIFWPALKSIHIKKRHWDKDADELWQNLIWTFLKVVCRVNLERRPDRLVQKVYSETFHHLYDEYRSIWKRAKREPALDSAEIEALADAVEGIDFEGIDLRKAHQREVNRLQKHRDAGRISETNFLLLLATRMYGQSIAEYARGAGLNTAAATKRRQRVEAAILRYEKDLR